jgi:hypothetical protein
MMAQVACIGHLIGQPIANSIAISVLTFSSLHLINAPNYLLLFHSIYPLYTVL